MTTLTIFGAGNMARGIATRALAGGNTVQIIAPSADRAAALAGELSAQGQVTAGAHGEAPAGEVVVLAVPYGAAAGLVEKYGADLDGKVVVDISNPLNETYNGLVTPAGSSAAEEIAKVAPAGAKVVKAWNTTFAGTLVAGQGGGHVLDVFVAGDDADAKAVVTGVVEAGGSRAIDAGPLSAARALEAFQLLHIGLQFSRGTQFGSAVKIVD